MSLDQELPKLFESFERNSEEKALNFQSTVDNSIRFSEKLQDKKKKTANLNFINIWHNVL
jgi:hypothetical protein